MFDNSLRVGEWWQSLSLLLRQGAVIGCGLWLVWVVGLLFYSSIFNWSLALLLLDSAIVGLAYQREGCGLYDTFNLFHTACEVVFVTMLFPLMCLADLVEFSGKEAARAG